MTPSSKVKAGVKGKTLAVAQLVQAGDQGVREFCAAEETILDDSLGPVFVRRRALHESAYTTLHPSRSIRNKSPVPCIGNRSVIRYHCYNCIYASKRVGVVLHICSLGRLRASAGRLRQFISDYEYGHIACRSGIERAVHTQVSHRLVRVSGIALADSHGASKGHILRASVAGV